MVYPKMFKPNKPELHQPGKVEAKGILDSRILPDSDFDALWDSIILDEKVKERLICQAILNFTLRSKINRADLPFHGIILLVGPPGTGKTSLAKGLASKTAKLLKSSEKPLYLEVEPHSLTSAALGRSQKAVTDLLGSTIPEIAAERPTIVLLDEIETLAADRTKMSLEANPVDVHRATDAVLAQLDQLAMRYPNLLFVATSNFAKAIDQAFISRADFIHTIGNPNKEACRQILTDTIKAIDKAYPGVNKLLSEPDFEKAVNLSEGLDGRRLRKLVAAACASSKETALNPTKLSASNILAAVEHEKKEANFI